MSSNIGTTFSHFQIPYRIAPPSRDHKQHDESTTQCTLKPLGRFSSLPSELLLNIFEDLEQDDWICLALTCKRMRAFLGPSIRWNAENNAYDTLAHQKFLSKYARDLPGWVACLLCVKLHPVRSISRPGALAERGSTWYHGTNLPFLHPSIPYHFDFLSLQMIMHDYRETGSTAMLDDLRFTHVENSKLENGFVYKKLTSIVAKIIDDALFMRVQEMIHIDIDKSDMSSDLLPLYRERRHPTLDLCKHRGPTIPFYSHTQYPAYRPRWESPPNGHEPTSICMICGITSAPITSQGGGAAYAMTRWIRLGAGRRLDADDAIWLLNWGQILHRARHGRIPDRFHHPEERTWRDVYEENEGEPWRKLLDDNSNLLCHAE